MTHHFILLCLNLFGLRFDREGWWLEHSMSLLWVDSSAEGAKNVSWRLLSPLWLWGSLTRTFTDKFVCMDHHFILLRLNPFGLRVDNDGYWFEHSMSWFRVCLSAEDAETVSWPWLPPLAGWGSLTIRFIGKFIDMTYGFILLWLNPFGLRDDREGSWCEHSTLCFRVCLSAGVAQNVSCSWLHPLRGWGSMTMTFTG